MNTNINPTLLRSFVAIIDAGSMKKASDVVCISQSAVSLQIKRLEDLLEEVLFNRDTHGLSLTEAGEKFLPIAREILVMNDNAVNLFKTRLANDPIKVGVCCELVDRILPFLFKRTCDAQTELQLRIVVADSHDLSDALESCELDIIVCLRPINDKKILRNLYVRWIGHRDLLSHDKLPLALKTGPCPIKLSVLDCLERIGRPYRIVLESESLSGIQAAVQTGAAVTCRTSYFTGGDRMPALQDATLPQLPDVGCALLMTQKVTPTIERVYNVIRECLPRPAETAPCVTGFTG